MMAGLNDNRKTTGNAKPSDQSTKASGTPSTHSSAHPKSSTAPRVPSPPKAPAPPPPPPPAKISGPSKSSGTETPPNPLNLPSPPDPVTGLIPPPRFVSAAAKAVALSLGSTHYALVGGAACLLLGSRRTTGDIDAVVLKGETKVARDKLAAQATHFSVDPKTRHTNYISQPAVEIEILTPPLLFKEEFEKNTPTITVNGIKVLKPTLILNAKCGSILKRGGIEKKLSDATDIRYLLDWCTRKSMWPTANECPNIDAEFVQWFIEFHSGGDLFKRAGWDENAGRWIH